MSEWPLHNLQVVVSTACPKGKAFLVGPPDEDGKRDVVAIVGLNKESRWSRSRRYFGTEVPVERWVFWVLCANVVLTLFQSLVRMFGGN